jgi:hypothetical protein
MKKNQKLHFIREDWTTFTTPERLSARAGVPKNRLRRLVVKELVDNALDAAGSCALGVLPDGGYFVENDGPGIDPDNLCQMFSVNRPLETTKLWRMPTRGALGNGLRVVVGAVIASNGSIAVITRGLRCTLYPDRETGHTTMTTEPEEERGTRIEIQLGEAIPENPDVLSWGEIAQRMAVGEYYKGSTSPYWYSVDAFWELFRSVQDSTVREVVARFDGFSGSRKASVVTGQYKNRSAASVTRKEAARLLDEMRTNTKPVKAKRLGTVGHDAMGGHYNKTTDEIVMSQNGRSVCIPAVIEVWARPATTDALTVCVNRSPAVDDVFISRNKNTLSVMGSGIWNDVRVGRDPVAFTINVTTPFVPLLSESKKPDLSLFGKTLKTSMEKAARKVRRLQPVTYRAPKVSQKDLVIENLNFGIDKASGEGQYRYSLRQLYYVLRPIVMEHLGKELNWDNFNQIITAYESETGHDLPGVYRDTRGSVYHPHTGQLIPLGTLAVEEYRRPQWTFNKVLYLEKEGFFELLRDDQWPERHDCALLTSKGYATRAARDLIDLMGESDEPIEFYCIHDADASGTLIYQALVEATPARPGRSVSIVNLGLEIDEARAMGLEVETVKEAPNGSPVADYVSEECRKAYQTERVELNAMTSPQFLSWLSDKFSRETGKVIPPDDVMSEHLREHVRQGVESTVKDRILREAQWERQSQEAFDALAGTIDSRSQTLKGDVEESLNDDPVQWWVKPVEREATLIVESM